MSHINEMIAELCPRGVEFRALGEVLRNFDSKRRPVTKSNRRRGKYPYYGANGIQDYVDDFIFDGTYVLVGEDGSVKQPDGRPVVNWAAGKIWVNNHAHILQSNPDELELRFVYFYLQTVDISPLVTGGTQPKLNQKNLNSIRIPVPPLDVQHEIVRMLDQLSSLQLELEVELVAELEARQVQYAYYRDSILSFDKDDCEWLTLREAAIDFGRGKSKHRPRNDAKLYGGSYPFIQTGDVRNGAHLITQHSQTYNEVGLAQSKLWPRGTICITIAANIAETGILDFDACFPDSVIGMVVNAEKTSQYYVEYLLQSLKANLAAKGRGSAQANINLATFENERFPFPPLKEQERIVEILDKFDALVSDLSAELPAELNARRKQYEYYRDQLLTFEELVV